jgi:hypothetical protein
MANKYFRKYSIPSAATETTIYTVPDANTAVLRSLRVTNGNASATEVTVICDIGGTDVYLLKDYPISPDGTVDVFNGVPCIMEAADTLTVEASTTTVYFYLSYLEHDRT